MHNANWNSDSWADGEFEPFDEPGMGELDELDSCSIFV